MEFQLYDVDMAGSLGKRLKKVVAIEPAEGRGGEYYCPFIIIMTKNSGKKFVHRRRPSSTHNLHIKRTRTHARGSQILRNGAGTEKKTSTPRDG